MSFYVLVDITKLLYSFSNVFDKPAFRIFEEQIYVRN